MHWTQSNTISFPGVAGVLEAKHGWSQSPTQTSMQKHHVNRFRCQSPSPYLWLDDPCLYVDSQATPFSLIGRGRSIREREWLASLLFMYVLLMILKLKLHTYAAINNQKKLCWVTNWVGRLLPQVTYMYPHCLNQILGVVPFTQNPQSVAASAQPLIIDLGCGSELVVMPQQQHSLGSKSN